MKYILISEYGELETAVVPVPSPDNWKTFDSPEEALQYMKENHISGQCYLIPWQKGGYIELPYVYEDDFFAED